MRTANHSCLHHGARLSCRDIHAAWTAGTTVSSAGGGMTVGRGGIR